ncbi:MAG: hypothetical protein MZV65_39950 [Chromatiales bacterium]|nr:hypothetical protein [Chromatiales bacterium]
MRTAELPVPGLLWGDYPEQRAASNPPGRLAIPAALRVLTDRARSLLPSSRARLLSTFITQRRSLRALDEAQFGEAVRTLRLALQKEGMRDAHMAKAFALAAVACERQLKVRVFDTQVIAAEIVLANRLAEMATGEGKTYAVALAAATAALAGIPVHVVTANDYLVARDAELLRPVYAALGLSVGAATQGQQPPERRAAYACDITYCTAKELVFDYLRDGLGRSRDPLQHALEPACRRDRCAAAAARTVHGDHRRGGQHSDRRGARAVHPVAAGRQRAGGRVPRPVARDRASAA